MNKLISPALHRLQTILLPTVNDEKTDALYILHSSSSDGRTFEENSPLNDHYCVSLGTYFNAFSVGKWLQYTKLTNLTLHIKISKASDLIIRGVHAHLDEACPCSTKADNSDSETGSTKANASPAVIYEYLPVDLCKQEEEGFDTYTISFNTLPLTGTVFAEFFSTKPFSLIGGYYGTNIDEKELPDLRLALGTCTYHREEELNRNLRELADRILTAPGSPLYDHLDVFVSDNGNSVDGPVFDCEYIHVYPNRNVGGSGGFTRVMIESVLNHPGTYDYFIAADDDIILSPDVLERTYALLQMLRPEYKNALIGGALLSKEEPWLQVESGGKCEGIRQEAFHSRLDLCSTGAGVYNEESVPATYNGWFYCCIPASFIREDNLPLPLFIHLDDIEYGIRNAEGQIILMNGICVWHPDPAAKQSRWIPYYDIRNSLIAMNQTAYPVNSKDLTAHIQYLIFDGIRKNDVAAAKLAMRAVSDYLDGPENLTASDPETMHSQIMALSKEHTSRKDIPSMLLMWIKLRHRYVREIDNANTLWKTAFPTLTSFAFWKRYLSL